MTRLPRLNKVGHYSLFQYIKWQTEQENRQLKENSTQLEPNASGTKPAWSDAWSDYLSLSSGKGGSCK